MTGDLTIPVGLRVHLAHATVQAIADEGGVDLLHIKGPAVAPELLPYRAEALDNGTESGRRQARMSTDADVLVRLAHVDAFMAGLAQHHWQIVTRFATGSAFEHAASLWHTQLGYVDVHRRFPGIRLDAEEAFARLWEERQTVEIAHRPIATPSVDAQRFILLLHAARGGGLTHPDARRLWTEADEAARASSAELAARFDAEVAFAAATGRIADYAGDPTADIWRIFASGANPTRLDEWRARFRATRGPVPRLRLAARALLVNTDHLGMELGRPPTRAEVVAEYLNRARHGVTEVTGLAGRGVRKLRGDDAS